MDEQLFSLVKGNALSINVDLPRGSEMDNDEYEFDDEHDKPALVRSLKEGIEEEEQEEEYIDEDYNDVEEQKQVYVKDLNLNSNSNQQPTPSPSPATKVTTTSNNSQNIQSLLNTIQSLENEISAQHQQLTNALNEHTNTLLNRERLHKEELDKLTESHSLSLRNKDNEIKALRQAKLSAFDKEKQSLLTAHANALSALHSSYALQLKQQQVELEQQHNMLQQQLQQQIALNNIISKVESSSTNINALLDKLSHQQQAHTSLEGIVNEKNIALESKLKQMEDDLRTAREAFASDKSNYEASQAEKRRLLLLESQTIQNELSQLKQLRLQVETQQQSTQDKFTSEKDTLSDQCDRTHCELAELKASFNLKHNELRQLTQLLRDEKALFEKHKQEQLSMIENKKNTYEQQQIAFVKEHNEIKQRILFLQEQERFYKEQHAKCEQEKEEIKQRDLRLSRQQEELFVAARRIDDSIKLLEERHMAVERESEAVRKQLGDIDDERMKVSQEKLRLEQERSDLRVREQAVEMMRRKYVQPMMMRNSNSGNFSNTNDNWKERILKEKEYLAKASKTECAYYSNNN